MTVALPEASRRSRARVFAGRPSRLMQAVGAIDLYVCTTRPVLWRTRAVWVFSGASTAALALWAIATSVRWDLSSAWSSGQIEALTWTVRLLGAAAFLFWVVAQLRIPWGEREKSEQGLLAACNLALALFFVLPSEVLFLTLTRELSFVVDPAQRDNDQKLLTDRKFWECVSAQDAAWGRANLQTVNGALHRYGFTSDGAKVDTTDPACSEGLRITALPVASRAGESSTGNPYNLLRERVTSVHGAQAQWQSWSSLAAARWSAWQTYLALASITSLTISALSYPAYAWRRLVPPRVRLRAQQAIVRTRVRPIYLQRWLTERPLLWASGVHRTFWPLAGVAGLLLLTHLLVAAGCATVEVAGRSWCPNESGKSDLRLLVNLLVGVLWPLGCLKYRASLHRFPTNELSQWRTYVRTSILSVGSAPLLAVLVSLRDVDDVTVGLYGIVFAVTYVTALNMAVLFTSFVATATAFLLHLAGVLVFSLVADALGLSILSALLVYAFLYVCACALWPALIRRSAESRALRFVLLTTLVAAPGAASAAFGAWLLWMGGELHKLPPGGPFVSLVLAYLVLVYSTWPLARARTHAAFQPALR